MTRVLRAFAVLALLGLAAPAFAHEPPRSTFRVHGTYFSPTSDSTVNGNLTLELDDAIGIGFGYERRLNRTLGLAVDMSWFRVEPTAATPWFGLRGGKRDVIPVTLGANFHYSPEGLVDLYAGPLVAYMAYEGFEDEITWGLNMGFDLPFDHQQWAFTGSVKYLKTEAEDSTPAPGERALSARVNPLVVSVGVAYRF